LYSTGYQLHQAEARSKACFVVCNRVIFVVEDEVVIAQTPTLLSSAGSRQVKRGNTAGGNMGKQATDRRDFLKQAGWMGSAALMAAMSESGIAHGESTGRLVEDAVQVPEAEKPKYHIKFAVCGMSHDHIYGMIGAVTRGGGELVAAWGDEDDKLAAFAKRFPGVKIVKTQDEIIHDPSIQLVLSSEKANERAGIGIRAMEAGKDYLSDKPGITTLEQLAQVRKTIEKTNKIYAIMYSERLDQRAGDWGGGMGSRPAWFYNDVQFGGILCDIGSHQLDQFLFYTGSKSAEVVASQVANVRHPDFPHFQDFGDMMLRGDSGLGYVRLDWFTPFGLGTWGDGRLFILGTDGYIEIRKYVDVAVKKDGNNLFLVNDKESRYIDCNNMPLPFGSQFVADIVNRTHTAQDQTQCLLAAELSIKAQKNATHVTLKA
jgi:predicted dehydrogenase